MEFFTIGVYNSTESEFFYKLRQNNIDTFCDIRQRRGVRGSKYAFVNSNRLQEKLSTINIKYAHIQQLAPTHEIRDLQKESNIENGESKRERQHLGQVFTTEYKNKIIKTFDFEGFFEQLENAGSKKVVIFCVEEQPEACHRSIAAKNINEKYGYKITHL